MPIDQFSSWLSNKGYEFTGNYLKMYCLALDTSLQASSVALYDSQSDRLLAHDMIIYEAKKKSHSENLLIQVDKIMNEARVDYNILNSLMVTIGPGSFTGIRIALAAARALALSLNIAIIPITTLRAIAANHIYKLSSNNKEITSNHDDRNHILVIIDAKRDQSYYQLFDHELKELTPPRLQENQKAIKFIIDNNHHHNKTGLTVVSNHSDIIEIMPSLHRTDIIYSKVATFPMACVFVKLSNFLEASVQPPAPLYIRQPDAKKPKILNLSSP